MKESELSAPVRLEHAPCPLGCNDGDEQLFLAGDRLFDLPGKFPLVRCRACGLMRTSPRPAREDMGFYYPADYGPYQAVTDEKQQSLLRQAVSGMIDFRSNAIPDIKPGLMLEAGCASGAFLARMAARGWEAEGIEFSEHAAKKAGKLGFRVLNCMVEDAPEPDRPYDLIAAWMVLEHLYDPVAVLRRFNAWAARDGWLVFSVPDAGALEFRLFRHNWYALHMPNHLFHFTAETVTALLERTGWKVEKIMHQRLLTNFFMSCTYAVEERFRLPSPLRRLLLLPERSPVFNLLMYLPAVAAAACGQTGRMTVWARKAGR